MTAPLILALDISKSCTGVAFGRAGETPRFLSIIGKEMDDIAAMMKLGTWLIEWTKLNRPDWIFYEAPIDRVLTDAHTTIVLAKMTAVVELVAGMKGIQHRKANIQTVRSSFLGQGRPDDPKHFAKLMAESLGWQPKTLDEADAAGVWYFAAMQVGRNAATYITPMQRAKVADEHEARRIERKSKRRARA